MFSLRQFLPFVMVSLLVAGPAAADERFVCESFKERREYCSVPGAYDADIRLARRLSDARCDEGRSWGRDDRGVWVDEGCRAEFVVRRDYAYGYDRRGYDDRGRYEDRGWFDDRRGGGYYRDRRELERERERLAAERAQFERDRVAAVQPQLAPLNCPPGTRPSTHRCTPEERKRGCKDYGANDGTGRGCSNF